MSLDSHPRAGNILVASPTLLDRNFSRTVVLLCAHTPEGSLGLVLNRPSQVTLADVLVGVPRSASQKVQWGGPVSQNRFLLLQRHGVDTPEETIAAEDSADEEITAGIRFGREQDFLHDLLEEPSQSRRYRMYAGYAGWGEGQLQAEMDQCSWLIAPTEAVSLIFDTQVEKMWTMAIRSLGPEYAHLATMPLDPRVN